MKPSNYYICSNFFYMSTVHKSRYVYFCVSLWLNITLSQLPINGMEILVLKLQLR